MHAIFDQTSAVSPLLHAYQSLKSEQASLRRRDAAEALSRSEAELVDAQIELRRVRLNDQFPAQIGALHRLGNIMTLTRNDAAVHERKGIYPQARVRRPMGLVISKDRKIDLRLILTRWHQGFAVAEQVKGAVRYSLQYFDAQGNAIQKIFVQPDSHFDAYIDVIHEFRAEDQSGPLAFEPAPDAEHHALDEQVDVAALTQEWNEITDVHQFFGMLRKHQVSRQQAFRLVGPEKAQPFDPARIKGMLEEAAQAEVPIMCFVGNRGNIQIHSGAISKVRAMGPWLNVLDPEFNLHLQMEKVGHAWLVRKPSKDGFITSLELYMANGETAAQFFGVRTEGKAENLEWRALAESMLDSEPVCA